MDNEAVFVGIKPSRRLAADAQMTMAMGPADMVMHVGSFESYELSCLPRWVGSKIAVEVSDFTGHGPSWIFGPPGHDQYSPPWKTQIFGPVRVHCGGLGERPHKHKTKKKKKKNGGLLAGALASCRIFRGTPALLRRAKEAGPP